MYTIIKRFWDMYIREVTGGLGHIPIHCTYRKKFEMALKCSDCSIILAVAVSQWHIISSIERSKAIDIFARVLETALDCLCFVAVNQIYSVHIIFLWSRWWSKNTVITTIGLFIGSKYLPVFFSLSSRSIVILMMM